MRNYNFTDELAEYVDRSFDFQVPPVVDDAYRNSFDDTLDAFYEKMFGDCKERFAIGRVEDREIPHDGTMLPIRVYWPENCPDNAPCMMMYHGGAFITGSIKGLDYFSRYVCKNSGRVVVSVYYRLAPQVKAPVCADDCYAALEYVYRHPDEFGIDPMRIATCGDSAGGNLSAVMAMKAMRNGLPLEKQVMVYPCVDMTVHDTPSRRRYGKGYSLDVDELDKCSPLYVQDEKDLLLPEVSPLLADEAYIRGQAPAMIVMAACCPLTSDCIAYAQKLKHAGVKVTARLYRNMPHSFIIFNYPETYAAMDDISAFLRGDEVESQL